MAIAALLIQIAGALTADGGLDRGIDVAGREAVARGACAVDVDLERRLTERVEYGQVGDAGHRGEHSR